MNVPLEVNAVIVGALTIILNCLSTVLPFAVALIVNVEVVSEPTPPKFPDIAPVEVFKDAPEGKEPERTE